MAVDLRWHRSGEDADACLVAHLHGLLGPAPVETGRLCPACGSHAHGRPWARHGPTTVPVSISRCGPHLVTAVGATAPVGVDVESVAAVAGRWDPGLVLAPGEVATTPEEQARTWTRKEAVLKAYGVGLARPMEQLVLADFEGELADVPAPAGHVAAVAVLG